MAVPPEGDPSVPQTRQCKAEVVVGSEKKRIPEHGGYVVAF